GPTRTEAPFPTAPATGKSARGWVASAYNGAATTERLKTVALCSHDSKAVAQTKTMDVPPTTAAGKLVYCPDHARATGGGFVVHSFLSSSKKPFNVAENPPSTTAGFVT